MQTVPNKTYLKKRFKELYPAPARLLAVQLDGFSHRLVYDTGKRSSIQFDYFSHCMPEGNWSSRAASFFRDISNAGYQNNAREIIFLTPAQR